VKALFYNVIFIFSGVADGTGSESRPVTGFVIRGVEILGFATDSVC
jgi:hypothetical protein